jgi:WD40 repeat protein
MRIGGNVVAVAFSPDGRNALTGSWNDTARRWDLSWLFQDIPPEELLLKAQLASLSIINDQGNLEPLSVEEWHKLKRKLESWRNR